MKDMRAVKQYKKIVVDGMNLASRSHHGIKRSWEGRPTGMLYGVVRFILSMRTLYPQAQIVFLWEGGDSKRKKLHPMYKANRAGRTVDGTFGVCLEVTQKVVGWMGCDQVRHVGLEADDLAGWFVGRTPEDEDILLVSNDEDWWQFMGPHVDILRKDTVETYAEVGLMLGFAPEKVGLFKVLTGDKSDGIPGIPRMSAKAAAALVTNCGSYEEFRDLDLKGINPSWERWEKSIDVLWESVILRNAELILYHPDWVEEDKVILTPGEPDAAGLRDALEDNGMVKMIEKLEALKYV